MNYCEHTANGTLDSTLRTVDCDNESMFGIYDKQTLEIFGHMCAKHVGDVSRDYGTVLEPGVSVQQSKRALGLL